MATLAVRRALVRGRLWRTVLRAAGLAAAIGGAYVFVLQPLTGHFPGEFEDFAAYLGAAQAAASHGDIYAAFVQQNQNVALSGFDYPPIVALALSPLAWLPAQTAATLWLLLDVACTVAGCIVVARTALPEHWPRLELAMLGAFAFSAAMYNFWHGQMNPEIFLLLALAFRSWVRGDEALCGVLVGIAAAIKLAPLVLVLLLLRRRWWQGAAVALGVFVLAAGAGVLAFGIHTAVEYVQSVLPVLGRDDGWLYNQSWDGVVSRLADHSVLQFQPQVTAIRVVVLVLSAASVLAAAWSVRPAHGDREARAGQFGAGVVAMLLAGTITWYAHDVHLLIAFAAAAVLVARRAAGHALLMWSLLVTLLLYGVMAPLLIASASMTEIAAIARTAWWYPLLIVTSLPALSSCVFLVALARSSRNAATPRRALVRAAA
jgi:Glycosyltransferase family 87